QKAQHDRSSSLTNERSSKKLQFDILDYSIPLINNDNENNKTKEIKIEVNPIPSTSSDKENNLKLFLQLTINNFLKPKDSNTHNIINFKKEDNTFIFFAYCVNEDFLSDRSNKEKINVANENFNRPQLILFISVSVKPHPENKQTKIV
ncbi:16327_t:CDS:1, partial [Funneliformis geosporum]